MDGLNDDDSDNSVIHQDSDDDDFEHDDDIDIGFRRHQYETFDDEDANNNRKRKRRRSGGKTRRKDEAIYGVFMDDDNDDNTYTSRKRNRQGSSNAYEPAPMFVAAKRKEEEESTTTTTAAASNSMFVAASQKQDDSMFVAAQKQDDSMFVAASQKQEEPKQQQQQQQQQQQEENNNMFVAAASTSSSKVQETNNKGNAVDGGFGTSVNDEDNKSDDDKEIEQKQKEADQYFLSLLNQARAKKKKRPPPSSVPTPPPHAASFHRQQQQQDPVALGLMPSSFGGGGGFYSSSEQPGVWPPPEKKKIKKDPNIAKWEKHTKGIGSKLLAKMGWSGKGGLGGGGGGGGSGSNKRQHQKKEEVNSIGVADGTSNDNNNNSNNISNLFQPSQPHQQQGPPPTTTATLPSSSKKKPKAGISRPVEVVVRPNNMGLGFGSFKEATQLKVNRQIEAEVRGIEVDEPSRKKMKKKKSNYYGENDDDEDDIMDDDKNNGLSYKVRTTSSAIPSTEDLLEQKQWKKLRTGNQRKKKMYPKAQIIPYEKLLEQNQIENGGGQSTIIDMRGPLYDKNRSEKGKDEQDDYGDNGENKKVLLAEELLHNVSFLLNTYENKLHSSANFAKSTEQKVASLKSDLVDMRKRKSDGSNRLSKIEKTIQIVKQIDGITTRAAAAAAATDDNNNLGSNSSSITLIMDQVQAEIKELEESYTSEERQSLRFWEIIVPSLLSPITKLQMDRWDPLKDDISKSKEVMDSFFNLHLQNPDLDNSSNDDNDKDNGAVIILRSSMIENQLVPRIKQVLSSSRWNPVLDTDIALNLYEYLDGKIQSMFVTVGNKKNKNVDDGNNVFPAGDDDHSTDENHQTHNRLLEIVKKEIILDTIHPKILTALSNWKPELRVSKPNGGGGGGGKSSDVQIANRFDLWILPWMPYLDHYPALIPNLLSDSKRKLKTGISYLQKRNGSNADIEFLRASVGLLKPWRRIFDQKDLQRIVSDSITPKLARCLAKSRIQTKNVSSQTWTAFDIVFEMHGLDLLSDIDFLSIIEGEALVNLVSTINEFLLEEGNATTTSIPAMAKVYRVWKMHTFLGSSRNGGTSCFTDRSLRLVQTDRQICCLFYTILRMLHFTSTSEQDKLEQINCPITNYRTVLARRIKERRNAIEDDMVRLENARSATETDARIRLRRRNNVTSATFREVVEEFTNERGILFQPKMGANSRKDGKQIFICGAGGTAVYLDGDVIFAQTVGSDSSSSWRPVPLEQLEAM